MMKSRADLKPNLLFMILILLSSLVSIEKIHAKPKAKNPTYQNASQNVSQKPPINRQRIVSPSSRLKIRAQKSEQEKKVQETQGGGGKIIEFKQLSVEGTVQRPSASYFLQRRKLKFRGIEPRKSFVPEILKTVKRYPF